MAKETGVPRENHRPAASHRQTLSHNVVHPARAGFELTTLVIYNIFQLPYFMNYWLMGTIGRIAAIRLNLGGIRRHIEAFHGSKMAMITWASSVTWTFFFTSVSICLIITMFFGTCKYL